LFCSITEDNSNNTPETPEIQTNSSNETIDLWSRADNIFKQYFSLPNSNRKPKPIDFWVKHKILLGELFNLALNYLVIPATSLPSERIFSKAGEIMCQKRNRLSPKNLDIIFLNKKNLKNL